MSHNHITLELKAKYVCERERTKLQYSREYTVQVKEVAVLKVISQKDSRRTDQAKHCKLLGSSTTSEIFFIVFSLSGFYRGEDLGALSANPSRTRYIFVDLLA
jgi:hypothetical protein